MRRYVLCLAMGLPFAAIGPSASRGESGAGLRIFPPQIELRGKGDRQGVVVQLRRASGARPVTVPVPIDENGPASLGRVVGDAGFEPATSSV